MVDAVGSVAKIVGVALKIKEAASTVHQNKKDCHHIKRRVEILDKTLSHQENNTELMEDSAVTAALKALGELLAEALEAVWSLQQQRCVVCAFYTTGRLSRKLGKMEQRISYLNFDAMLTIMSYQLLRKLHDGVPPHSRTQIYSPGTHTPFQRPSVPQKVVRIILIVC
ncbi:hypothetical protein VPH35_000179 [Triticum aestivum]